MLVLPGMDGNDPAPLRLIADDRAAGLAVAAAGRFATAAGLGAGTSVRLAIVVEELILNIVDHGAAHGGPITLALARADGGIRIVLIDGGMPFDIRLAPAAAISARGGGVGLALVRAWTRIERHGRADGLNRLDLLLPTNEPDP